MPEQRPKPLQREADELVARPVLTAVSVLAAGAVVDLTSVPTAWVCLAASGSAVAAVLTAAGYDMPRGPVAHLAATGASAAAWLTYVAAAPHGLLSSTAMGAWVTGSVILSALYPLARKWVRRPAGASTPAAAVAVSTPTPAAPTPDGDTGGNPSRPAVFTEIQVTALRNAWERIFTGSGMRGVRVLAADPRVAGYSLLIQLPASGSVTPRMLAGAAGLRRLEVAAARHLGGLRQGALRVQELRDAAHVRLEVVVDDVLAKLIPFPDDYGYTSTVGRFSIGRYESGEDLMFWFGLHTAIVGASGGGKSNLLNVLVRRALQTVDTVVLMIDPKQRGVRPWMVPYLSGQTDRPALCWVATHEAEWSLMLKALRAGLDARTGVGGEEIEPSRSMPRIVLIADEIADVCARRDNREAYEFLLRKGRSEAFTIIVGALRGTADILGSGQAKAGIKNVFGLPVNRQSEATHVLPNDPAAQNLLVKISEHPGSVLAKLGPRATPLPAKIFRQEFDDIPSVARQLTPRLADLDEMTARAFDQATGGAYSTRWSEERCGHLRGDGTPVRAATVTSPQPASTNAEDASRPGLPPRRPIPTREEMFRRAGITPPPEIPDEWRDTLRGISDLPEYDPRRPGETDDPADRSWKDHAGAFMTRRGADGFEPAEVIADLEQAGLAPRRETVQRWLSQLVKDERLHRLGHGRYAIHPPDNDKE